MYFCHLDLYRIKGLGAYWWLLHFFLSVCIFRYELAEECTDDDDAKLSISELRKSVLEELKLHDSFVKVIDIRLALIVKLLQ